MERFSVWLERRKQPRPDYRIDDFVKAADELKKVLNRLSKLKREEVPKAADRVKDRVPDDEEDNEDGPDLEDD